MAVRLGDLDVRKETSLIGSTHSPILFSEETKGISPWLREIEGWDERFIYLGLLNEIFRYLEQEVATQTLDNQINYKDLYRFISIKLWFKRELEPRELEQEALLSIAMEFSSRVEKVKSIYVQRYREELQVQILLSITQYDSDLMDVLLDIEYEIRKRYPDIVFEFFYPPAGISDKKDFIHPKAQCIYMR